MLGDREAAADVHDLPDAAIARALACRTGTVRSLLSRGREVIFDPDSSELLSWSEIGTPSCAPDTFVTSVTGRGEPGNLLARWRV